MLLSKYKCTIIISMGNHWSKQQHFYQCEELHCRQVHIYLHVSGAPRTGTLFGFNKKPEMEDFQHAVFKHFKLCYVLSKCKVIFVLAAGWRIKNKLLLSGPYSIRQSKNTLQPENIFLSRYGYSPNRSIFIKLLGNTWQLNGE